MGSFKRARCAQTRLGLTLHYVLIIGGLVFVFGLGILIGGQLKSIETSSNRGAILILLGLAIAGWVVWLGPAA